MPFQDTSLEELNQIINQSAIAFEIYRHKSGIEKANFLRNIATAIETLGQDLIEVASQETNLPEGRLLGERGRTTFQLKMFADLLEEGSWLEARIDTAQPNRQPLPKPDIRKMLMPIGTVAVFGSSNFPFAYSTAGGDTASALAAGCCVVLKAHPAHPKTSAMVANAIQNALVMSNMPAGVFAHVFGKNFEIGKALVMHPHIKAVGFTGSLGGGKALFDLANQRPEPIPVFAEMGSINPVVLMPQKLATEAPSIAKLYAGSITQGVGQFCTNPGLILGIANPALDQFIETLAEEIRKIAPATMLHAGIYQNYEVKRSLATEQTGVVVEAVSDIAPTGLLQGIPTVASVDAQSFLDNPLLHQEVFGPYSLIVKAKDLEQLSQVVAQLEGQLTATIMATEAELIENQALVYQLQNRCGRIIFNGVPTGVEVGHAMQHGGPFPASTDNRFGAVGPDAIKRFVRPFSFQNFPESLLPDALKTDNPLKIKRIIDNVWTN